VTGEDERAGRVRPEYTGGDLVKVAFARNIAEAEMIQGILRSEGIPSIERRTRGFDVPDFLAGGPRDILVPEAAEQATRQLLSDLDPSGATHSEPVAASEEHPLRFALWFLVALVAAVALVWVVYQLMV
jgi:hypothetical protein